ncbi:hypothetical protein EKD16_12950 [Streptomonospora litoralis]|uniref:HTH cro/C1-type domain-containing protein n=1 Tax=Streptomonospora litoralis TaxID=2498135 RepID=A0A4V0ZJR2_9ACTN|nr:hypothetical protein EKD16_12950 [Streptomonospora litoralis]
MAKALGWQQTKVSKIETGERKKVTADELSALLDYYGEDDPEVRESLHECARLGNQRGWWSKYRDLLPSGLPDFEAEASVIKTYESQVIPGLLQTPDYAEAIFRANLVRSGDEVQERVAARLKRQDCLNRVDPPSYWVILDEAALRRVVGTREVMSQQLRHLTHMAARHNVNIYVLPFSEGAHPATVGSFVIMEFPDPMDVSIGYVENPTSSVYVEEGHELADLNAIFAGAQGAALSPVRSLAFINDVIESLEE